MFILSLRQIRLHALPSYQQAKKPSLQVSQAAMVLAPHKGGHRCVRVRTLSASSFREVCPGHLRHLSSAGSFDLLHFCALRQTKAVERENKGTLLCQWVPTMCLASSLCSNVGQLRPRWMRKLGESAGSLAENSTRLLLYPLQMHLWMHATCLPCQDLGSSHVQKHGKSPMETWNLGPGS